MYPNKHITTVQIQLSCYQWSTIKHTIVVSNWKRHVLWRMQAQN